MRLKDFSVAELKKMIAIYDAGEMMECEIEFSMIRRALEEVMVEVSEHGAYETVMMGCSDGSAPITCAELTFRISSLGMKVKGQVWHERPSKET